MPAAYAHYRFGSQALPRLPEQAAELIRRNRRMYDLGLQGPDFLFYYNPFAPNRLGALGSEIHRFTGRSLFGRAARTLKLCPDEVREAYLFGVLGHFALDSHCHPYINTHAGPGHSHIQMEAELDRRLLEEDAKPYYFNVFRGLKLESKGDAARIAEVYPGITAAQVSTSFFNMAWMGAFLSAPEGLRRNFIASGILGGSIREHMLPRAENPGCAHLMSAILSRYAQAETRYPVLAWQLWEHIHKGQKLGPDFDTVFG